MAKSLLFCTLAALVLAASAASAFDGAALYAAKCAECHGDAGQGSDYRRLPLTGDLPVRELARVIADTMPEGDPGSCVGAEAEAIARYAHEAFYSQAAQARLRPPRRDLARLTARQLEQSLADLVGSFGWRRGMPEERGVTVTYSSNKRNQRDTRHARRVERRADLTLSECDFLPEEVRRAPSEEEVVDGKKSSARLDAAVQVRGGLLAPRTGLYDLSVESPNGFRMKLNGDQLLDGRVRTGDSERLSATVRLIGGRVYPFSIEARRTREPDLRLKLLWEPPGGVEEVIPNLVLSPKRHPRVYATGVRLPPDDRSVGYMRGADVSAAWDEATTNAALETVQAVLDDLPRLTRPLRQPDDGDKGSDSEEGVAPLTRETVLALCERFGEQAFRRPLSDREWSRYVGQHFPEEGEPTEPELVASLELSMLMLLKSPQFLYPEVALLEAPAGKRAGYAAATRLALGLWDSLPDTRLRRLAARGALGNRRAVLREANRLLKDDRARTKLARFFEAWLRLDQEKELSRDPEAYPDFDARIAADMRTSLELLLDDLVWEGEGDFRQLFLTDRLYVNPRLAGFLGVEVPDSVELDEFVRVPTDTAERVGVVSHPLLVTSFSYYRETSPIHRGVFLARKVLGRSLRPPPEAVAPLAPELAPDMTTRERVTAQTSPGACQACHVLINDLGFTLEHFDAVGRFRHRDVGQPIDASGGYIATNGDDVRLQGSRDLAEYLAGSEDVQRAFVTQLFEHVTKQPPLAYGPGTVDRLLAGFCEDEYRIPALLAEIVAVAALAD